MSRRYEDLLFWCKIPTTTKLKTSSQQLYTWKQIHHRGASECLQDSTHAFFVEVEVPSLLGSFRSFSGGIYFQKQTCKHTYNNCIRCIRYSTYVCIYIYIWYIYIFEQALITIYMYIILLFLVQLVCIIIYISHSKASSSTDRNTLEAMVSSGNRAPKLGCKQETFETVYS